MQNARDNGAFAFEVVTRIVHNSDLVLRPSRHAPLVSLNAAATPDVRGHSQPCVVASWGIVAAVTQHGIGDVHELLLLETRHRYRGTTINGRTGMRRGRHDCSAEARCELVLRSNKLEPVEKSHELESAPKPTEHDRRLLHTYESITKLNAPALKLIAFEWSGFLRHVVHRSTKQFYTVQTHGTDKRKRAALGPASRSPHQYNGTGSVHSKH